MLRRSLLLLCCLAASLEAQVPASTRRDVVKGRVTTDSGAVLADADVIVTMAPTRVVVQGKTDASGLYEITLANGTGEYLVYIASLGRQPLRKRLTAVGGDSTFVVDARLALVPVTALAAVRSVAARTRPQRSAAGLDPAGQGLTAGDRSPEGVLGQISPDLAANLEAMASTIPGFASTPGGLSVSGMTGANLSTLNGLSMGGDVPRDAKVNYRYQTSPWDPTRGGFAGAQLGLNFGGGGPIAYRRGRLLLDAPPMQLAQPGASALGQKYRNTIVGLGGDGPIVPQKYFYNYAVEGSRVTTPVASLLDLDPLTLEQNGIARDSAQRFMNAVIAQQLPLTLAGIPGDRQSTAGSFIARLDRSAQPSRTPGGVASAPWWVLVNGSMRKNEALSLSPSMLPAFTAEQQNAAGALQAFYSNYVGPDRMWLNETMLAFAGSAQRGDPYLAIPSGSVRISSLLDDGSTSVRSLSFGGNSASYRRDNNWSAEAVNSTTFFPANKTSKPVKIFLQGRYDGFDQVLGASRLGSFSFASIEDFETNTPSSFTRALRVPDRRGGELSGAASVGVNWTISKVNLVGGVRADANMYTARPELNPSLKTALDVETDRVPNTIALSPRLGFTWTYKGPTGFSARMGNIGSTYRAPTTLRGGVGRFRNRLTPTLIADALTSTGLPGGMLTLTCFGPAAPIPNWSEYLLNGSTIPQSCTDGSSTFTDASPNVVAFAKGYGPQDSWKANLGATRSFRNTYVSADLAYSINLGQPSSFDRNFAGVQRLTLADEDGRPVFVSASSIVPSSGVVSPVEGRSVSQFGRVTERRSDMRSEMKQLVIHSLPNTSWFDPFLAVDYVYSDTRARRRGFDATTSGDPRAPSWSRDAFTPRHQWIVQTGKSLKGLVLTTTLNLRSGILFTPLVGGDINGDGMWNDRAFVFAPGASDSASTAVANAITKLVQTGPSRVGKCLQAQLSSIASENSCKGPWTASMNARLGYNGNIGRLGRRMTVSLNLANPLAALDRALHAADDLRGWGGQAFPDPTLLHVRGFDAGTGRFLYEVNSRFGSTSPRTTAVLNPFRATLDFRFDLGRNVAKQQLDITLRPPRGAGGSRASADTIKRRLLQGSGATGPQDIYGHLLWLKDSIALSADQMQKLEAARVPFRAKIDSMYTELANYLATMPGSFDGDAAATRIRETNDSAWVTMHAQGKAILAIISPAQLQLVWSPIQNTLTKPFNRSFWAGAFGASWFGS